MREDSDLLTACRMRERGSMTTFEVTG